MLLASKYYYTQKASIMSDDFELNSKLDRLPSGLREIVDEFRGSTPRERLELLLEFSQDLPDLPDYLAEQRDQLEQVHECQTPVFLFTELEDGSVHFHVDIPQESPTVRGYAAILADGFDGAAPEAVLNSPDDVYNLLGLQEAVTPQRLRGLHALMLYMKRQVKKLVA
jgi:cysteine desulfuration protein SufE